MIARCLHTADVVDAVNFGRSEGTRDLGARRRPQRRRQGGHRRRADDRPLADEGHPRRPGATDGPGAGRRHGRRARPCHRRLRARDSQRRRLDHRDRGSHARRRDRLADGQVRDGRRQPALRRGRARVRRGRHRERGRRSRPVLGAPRRRRQLRRRDLVRVPHAPARQRARRSGAASARGGAAAVLVLPRVRRRPPGRALHAGRLPARARRIGDEALRDRGLPRGRRRRPGRRRRAPAARVRLAGRGHDPAHAVPSREHGRRLAVPSGRAQLLEVGVLLRAVRRGRRGDDQRRSSRRPASCARSASRTSTARSRACPRRLRPTRTESRASTCS